MMEQLYENTDFRNWQKSGRLLDEKQKNIFYGTESWIELPKKMLKKLKKPTLGQIRGWNPACKYEVLMTMTTHLFLVFC